MFRLALLTLLLFLLSVPVSAQENEDWYPHTRYREQAFVADIDGDTMVMGDIFSDNANGSLIVYTRDTLGRWSFQTRIPAPSGTYPHSEFGWDVELEGNTLAVTTMFGRSTYIYERRNGNWQQVLTLPSWKHIALDKGNLFLVNPSYLPRDAHIRVYRRIAGTWTRVQTIRAPDDGFNGFFGHTIYAKNGVLVVGEPVLPSMRNSTVSDEVHIYTPDSTGKWTLRQTLYPSDPAHQDNFSVGVATDGQTIMVGARGLSESAVYVYNKTAENQWAEHSLILPVISDEPSPTERKMAQNFGSFMEIEGDQALISVYGIPIVYHFKRDALGQWQQQPMLLSHYNTWIENNTRTMPNDYGCGIGLTHDTIVTCSQTEKGRFLHILHSTELITNGGFELRKPNGLPRDWKPTTTILGGVKCNREGEIVAYSGQCALRLKNGSGALVQQIVPNGIRAGNTLTLKAALKQPNPEFASDGFIRVKLNYADGTKGAVNLFLSETPLAEYTEYTSAITLTGTLAAPIKVTLTYTGLSGIWVDDVSLKLSFSADVLPELP